VEAAQFIGYAAMMDVRWKGRKLHQPGTAPGHDDVFGQDVRWTAVVVESVMVSGTPRQRQVALLASITESEIEIVHHRRYFWGAVHKRLDQLGNRLSADDRRRIEAAITHKVLRLSPEEHDASVNEVQKYDLLFRGPAIKPKPYRAPT
jgi:hypothetical protein